MLEQIAAALAHVWGEPLGPLGLAHGCPGCGSTAHGAPTLVGLPPGRSASVSFAHVRDLRTGVRVRLGAWWAPEPASPRTRRHRPSPWGRGQGGGRRLVGCAGLGLDLERADAPAFAAEGSLGDVGFSTAERARVRALPRADRALARAALWTRKEALAKAAGTGFTGDPADVDALEPPPRVVLLDLGGRIPHGLVGSVAFRVS